MSASYLVHNDTIIFDGTNYVLWRNRMLSNLWTLCPNIERFLDVGFSPPMDLQNLSIEDEKNGVTQHTTACCSMQVVDITIAEQPSTNITSLRMVQQKHCRPKYKMNFLLLQTKA
jgi:hypothetical protein